MRLQRFDWELLHADAEATGNPVIVDLVDALERAMVGRSYKSARPLLELLDRGTPIPNALSPVLAALLRRKFFPDSPGKPPKLTVRDDHLIRVWHDFMTERPDLYDIVDVSDRLEEAFKVSEASIARSLKRTQK